MRGEGVKKRINDWTAAIVLICIALLIVLDIMYFFTYSGNVENAFEDSISQTIEQIHLNIMNEFVQMDNMTSYLSLNTTIDRALTVEASTQSVGVQYDEMQQIRPLLRACSTVNRALSVRLYVDDDKLYANEREFFFPMTEITENDLFSDIGFQSSFVMCPENSGGQTVYRIFCIKLIRSLLYFGIRNGAVATVIDESRIWNVLSSFEDEGRSIFLIDADMRILSGGDKSLIGSIRDYQSQIGYEDLIRGKNRLKGGRTIYSKLVGNTGWFIVWELNPRAYPSYRLFGEPVFFAIALSILLLLAMGFVFSYLIRRATARVTALSNVFKGKMQVDIPVTRFPLFKDLDEAINDARDLVQTGYEQIQTQIRMQSQLLQLQINPHFLYNSLDNMLWLIRKGDIQLSEQMINAMSRYLRLILNNGNDIVSLKDEIELMRAYIDMQKISCGNLVVDVMLESGVEELLIPKLTLQPIAENAVIHGIILGRKPTGHIDVLCYTEESILYITVTDNGEGIPEERLKKLNEGYVRTSAYGLYNVDQRIKLFSGSNDYGVSIRSIEGHSTTVTLRIAVRKPEPEQENNNDG